MLILICGAREMHLVPEQRLYSVLFSPLLILGMQNWLRQNHCYRLACQRELDHSHLRFLVHMNEKFHRHALHRA